MNIYGIPTIAIYNSEVDIHHIDNGIPGNIEIALNI